jgi:zinc transport system ATP-binding protein
MNPLIKIQNLTVGYDRTPVLQQVSLDILENDFLGVIGPNGGGKTTLLKAILGILKPIEGTIEFRSDIKGKNRPIGYLPQVKHIDRKFPITVFDVVKSGLMMLNGSKSSFSVKQNVNDLLNEMGIFEIKDKAIGELSGGQMQRVYLCRALISKPKVLMLDEPDTFVDNRFEGELYEKLRELNQNMAIILVSHDMGTIVKYVKTIACVNENLHYHSSNRITQKDLDEYNCPIQIIKYGEVPHIYLKHRHQ